MRAVGNEKEIRREKLGQQGERAKLEGRSQENVCEIKNIFNIKVQTNSEFSSNFSFIKLLFHFLWFSCFPRRIPSISINSSSKVSYRRSYELNIL
jgi:hypothetical protein